MMTTQEQADTMSAAYREGCDYRRRGRFVEKRNGDEWSIVFAGSEGKLTDTNRGINDAKRYVRKNNLRVFRA